MNLLNKKSLFWALSVCLCLAVRADNENMLRNTDNNELINIPEKNTIQDDTTKLDDVAKTESLKDLDAIIGESVDSGKNDAIPEMSKIEQVGMEGMAGPEEQMRKIEQVGKTEAAPEMGEMMASGTEEQMRKIAQDGTVGPEEQMSEIAQDGMVGTKNLLANNKEESDKKIEEVENDINTALAILKSANEDKN